MCALCAVLGSSIHWSDMAGREQFVRDGNKVSRRAERQRRISRIKPTFDYYGLTLRDLGGSAYLISNARGEEASVYQLEGIWAEAERLAGQPCDPLDADLLAHLSRGRENIDDD